MVIPKHAAYSSTTPLIIHVIQSIIQCSPAGVFGVVKEEATNSPLLENFLAKMLRTKIEDEMWNAKECVRSL